MEHAFLNALVIIFGVSAISVFLLHRLRVPSLVGFIAAGCLIGPYGLGFVEDVRAIEILADIGVILLLFVVGIEFSIKDLMKRKKTVLLGGGGQIALTIAVSAALTYPYAGNLRSAVFFGFLVALSSTAIVLKMLLERGEMDTPHGRAMVGILIFQDLCVVPLMLFTPALAGGAVDVLDIALTFLKAAAIIAIVLLAAKWVVPLVLHQVVHTRSKELFLITVILMCMGIALLTSSFGLSLALGAFLAGLVISESEYAMEATAEILPFKDSFMGLFFVSIGMLIDTRYISENWLKVALAVLVIFAIKAASTTASLLAVKAPPRTSVQSGLGLAQIGEFSFVLAAVGRAAGLMSEDSFHLFLSASVITMAVTPFVLKASHPVSLWVASTALFSRWGRTVKEEARPHGRLSEHVIIVGFGLNGRNLARTLKETGIDYVVLELNSDTVREEKKRGEPIYFGDGTSREILHMLGIERARLLVVAISDPASTRKIVAMARKANPSIHILVRTRYLSEVEDLISLGADEVIPEEFETSVEIFSRVLHHYGIPRNIITDSIEGIRNDGYKVLRTQELPKKAFKERQALLSEIETETYLIKEGSSLAGHSLREIQLRSRTGATAMAVQREGVIHQNPEPNFILKEKDIVLLVGKKEDINRAVEYIESEKFLILKYHR
jgi:CPA2 family monovalent cation:H+ antiporter-2